MKLIRFTIQDGGKPRLGVLTPLGILDALSCCELYCLAQGKEAPAIPNSPCQMLKQPRENMEYLRDASKWALNNDSAGTVLFHADRVRLLAPIARPPKIICIGLNYRDHCKEQGHDIPKSPVVFAKFPTATLAPGASIVRPRITRKLDYEAELGVVIGRGGSRIPQENALDYIGGYMNFNDISARDLQFSDGQWIRGKSCDTFAPMGPALVTPDEVPDPHDLSIVCRVNGKVMQQSNTGQMIFSVSYLVSFLSQFMTLEVGDVIATGTPPGVGVWRKPQVFLKSGDVVEIEIENLGVLSNPVVDEK